MPFCDIATGARLHYEDIGQGEALLLLHGRLDTAKLSFPNVIDWLKSDYHIYGPSLRGYGDSTPKPRDFPPDFYRRDAQDVLAFLDMLDIKAAHVLGYSDGGETALVAAGLEPTRFRSVAVIGAVGNFTPDIRPHLQRSLPATWITEDDKKLHGITDATAFIVEWINAMEKIIDSGGDISLSLAPNITCPVLIMLGEKDTLNPPHLALKFLEHTPNGRLEMFQCGHPVHDQQWSKFQRLYGDFLRSAG